jgi:hypothetical protein
MTNVSRHRRSGALALLVALLSLPVLALASPAQADDGETPEAPPAVSTEDAERQVALVAAEDRRLTETRTITSLARWQGTNWKTPYRLGSPGGFTLVLTPRTEAYTIDDLLQLAPQTFLRMSDGAFLLSENIVVTPRATLRLSAPGGLTLRLASGPDGFSTLVSMGGELEILGEERAPATVTSWDPDVGATDELTTDGRGYVRAIGGQFRAEFATFTELGFWSGRTGGLALTGTDRPNTGAIESTDDEAEPSGDAGDILGDVTWQPAGELEPGQTNPQLGYTVPAQDFVSTQMSDVTATHNAFGLFVSGANGVQVSDSTFSDNQFGGMVLHRYVTNGVITRTTAERNLGDGFALGRATAAISISESTAAHNLGSGFRLAGRPLAEGPSVVGASLRSYGNNSVSHCTATENGRYGIELLGGVNVGLDNNVLDGQDMGILVKGPAQQVSITGNTVRHSARHGIALVNTVSSSTVTGNVVDGATTGVYIRDSSVEVRGNTILGARSHGASLLGEVKGSNVSFNVLAGSGASALDLMRSHGDIAVDTNNIDGWHDTSPWYLVFKKLLQPMNALWSLIAVLMVVSAMRGRRAAKGIVQPYAAQMTQLSDRQPVVVDLSERLAVGE